MHEPVCSSWMPKSYPPPEGMRILYREPQTTMHDGIVLWKYGDTVDGVMALQWNAEWVPYPSE